MKTTIIKSIFNIALMLIISAGSLMAQKDKKDAAATPAAPKEKLTYVSPNAKLSKIYTKEELEKLGKLELTQVYMERVTVVTEIMPYIALHSKPGATLKEMGIPETDANLQHLDKEVKNKEAYIGSVKETLDDIIPYADKRNIIWSILFFQDIIQKADYTNAIE